MNTVHISGFPRIGPQRELKFALEAFWQGRLPESELQAVAAAIRAQNWALQHAAGVDLLPVGDFSLYDHVLDALVAVGAIPARFGFDPAQLSVHQYFELARGNAGQAAMEMTKWFDTNYHYLVPEWQANTQFQAVSGSLIAQVRQAQDLGYDIKPTLLGPVSLLWLGKDKGSAFERLDLLPALLRTYQQLLRELAQAGVGWLQLDEPILAVDLPQPWLDALAAAYQELALTPVRLIVGTYFGSVAAHLPLLKNLPVHGVHLDGVRAPEQLALFAQAWPENKVLSVGVIDGRNVWRADLRRVLAQLQPLQAKLGKQLWLSSSCSLLHVPQDLAREDQLPDEIKQWLAFGVQKLAELGCLKQALAHGSDSIQAALAASDAAAASRADSPLIHRPEVQARLQGLPEGVDRRHSAFAQRIEAQQAWLQLPLLPTTTIGSFPQTTEIRQMRAQFKQGQLSAAEYEQAMQHEITTMILAQEELGIDVLVHGEPERNDMVEYFGEQLAGYAFSRFGWVQSYGSRCVKPPIIYGDVARPQAMTVHWAAFAQGLTHLPVKGMLTGPVTMLQWSFVRNDVPRAQVCRQIALALNDEVRDLEQAGIKVIQIDEPAYREGLPLRHADWAEYLNWASQCFRLTCAQVADSTQIHTHMCYSEFNDILPAIAAMDADVITIETSRSDMALLHAFGDFAYPNDIGPGVYDIHSPRIPEEAELTRLLEKALQVIPARRLWVNPDCGLKTRAWPETHAALSKMVRVAERLRTQLAA